MSDNIKLSNIEKIKMASRGLRGTLAESLQDEHTGAIREDDQALIKFHGMYQQDDRDRREERAEKKLERLYTFMVRLRLTGGFMLPQQWVAIHHAAGTYSTGVIKITSRQTIQLHGIIKANIKPTLQAFHHADLTTIATCGDINRNVLCSAHPAYSPVHEQVFAIADKICARLLPKTKGYAEIWLDDQIIYEPEAEKDDLYQDRYLPRKFKIAIAIPPNNDVDVFANDIGLIAIIENNVLIGFNIAIGGGLASTHGNSDTYPRLATVIGFVQGEENVLKTVYAVAAIQRDYGNRTDRKFARLKYTVDKYGIDWFKKEIEARSGYTFETEKPYQFVERADQLGWHQNHVGKWYYTVFIENGRITDTPHVQLKTALLKIAQAGIANFRFTCNQNVIISDIAPQHQSKVASILTEYGIITQNESTSSVRQRSMACVAFPTCPLALAEAQRYLPNLLTKIELLLKKYELEQEAIIIRMTGCPNGCARSYAAEIGLIGTAYGKYNLYLGGDYEGCRLNKLYRENLEEATILVTLDNCFRQFKLNRKSGERFGDFANNYFFNT
ncbi:MAG: NADPH-dependent assimilatory sulfite reductase hemoprotein subunit [Hydrotalea flava]|nr:NADPH-dependent assimilatory sulfite reductase hemoprotein subunit [Hydrotalea flava]NIM39546.1 NADPH-dependent assimilatory sulfite reductase hemoprotein subunit [Hydrotalea flava]NIN04735.1 NADPH-dependent assimilatory sulfite reductase hemoprotein subunit [Hydrotalea flava]NIN16407.1 NADPH-dependent assimilatory sulfite reductase hemoprotein subunit [Hydrotalea flava]NIO95472.1 NADPH-dependent assimilatory sulfite reductase hemoprotein subunit [Hydrotalea flava]